MRPVELRWTGKQARQETAAAPLRLTDVYGGESPNAARLYHGDNLAVMLALLPEYAGRVSLIYLDPPFLARQRFRRGETEAYDDRWPGGLPEYLQSLWERLELVRELLADDGSLIVHVNWRVAPYVQLLLDELFGGGEREGPGRPGFRNEIVWGFGGGGNAQNAYRRKHDNLFWYTKSRRWTFHPQYRPYTEGTRQRGLTAVKGDGYELREEGASLETWWTDSGVQKILSPTAFENLKYPTQKPEALLERIIQGHSNPGERVADCYCGSGTTAAAAVRLGRRALAIDSSELAVATTWQRLVNLARLQEANAGTPVSVTLNRSQIPALPLHEMNVLRESGGASVTLPNRGMDGEIEYWAVDWNYGALRQAEGPPVFCHRSVAQRLPGRSIRIASQLRWENPAGDIAVTTVDSTGAWRFSLRGE